MHAIGCLFRKGEREKWEQEKCNGENYRSKTHYSWISFVSGSNTRVKMRLSSADVAAYMGLFFLVWERHSKAVGSHCKHLEALSLDSENIQNKGLEIVSPSVQLPIAEYESTSTDASIE